MTIHAPNCRLVGERDAHGKANVWNEPSKSLKTHKTIGWGSVRTNSQTVEDTCSAIVEAAVIIQYRESKGPLKTIDDLKKVPGINAVKQQLEFQ
jgi:Helix-hairpin-helix motif